MPDLNASKERIECPETSEIRTLIPQKWKIAKELPIYERLPISRIKHDHRAKNLFKHGNDVIINIKKEMYSILSLTEINQYVYATAATISEKLGKIHLSPVRKRGKNQFGERR